MPYLFIALFGALLYFHVYNFNYTYLDDASIIIDAYKKMAADPSSVLRVFTKGLLYSSQPQVYYRPIFDASFMLNSIFEPNHLAIFYFTNIFLHLAASCLVFRLLIILGCKRNSSFLLTLFFTASPMAVQTIAWLPGRSDTLVAIFCILSFIAFKNFIDTEKFRYYSLHLFFMALALFSKESAACLVIACFFYMRLILKRRMLSKEENLLMAGWFFILTGWFMLRHTAFSDPLRLSGGEIFRFITSNLAVIVYYIGKIFFPLNLSVWPTMRDSQLIPGFIAIFILTALSLFSKTRRNDYAAFGLLWFMLFILPALVRPNIGVSAVFLNTRAYLPMAGILILLAETDLIKKANIKKWPHAIIILCAITFYSLIALDHSYDFANYSAFWANARRTAPHSWVDPASLKK